MLEMGIESDRTMHHGHAMQVESSETKKSDHTQLWKVPVIDTVATEGEGVKELVESMLAHRTYLQESGNWFEREKARSLQEVDQLLRMEFISRLLAVVSVEEREKLIEAVAGRQIDPYSAVDQLVMQVEEVGSRLQASKRKVEGDV
jgi:LAO/AO transport system kinase